MIAQHQGRQNFLRNIIGEYMEKLGELDGRVIVVNADLMGTCRNQKFVERFPDRSFNVGIAEQNLVSFSAGLAHEGFIPYAFSMAPFISMRACEQCRTDVAYGRTNVRLIGTYAGVSGGISGATHWAIEDAGIMTAIPEMTVLEPCDPTQAQKMLVETLSYNGPIYIRNSVEPVTSIYDQNYKYQIGKATIVRNGNDGAFVCSGVIVQYAIEAAIQIERNCGKKIRVVDMHTIKPIDKQAIIDAAKTGRVVAAQDHNIIGGLGSAVAVVLAEGGIGIQYKILGIKDEFVAMAHAPYLYSKYGLSSKGLYDAMNALL